MAGIIDLASLRKNDFEETGIKGIAVELNNYNLTPSQRTITDERANGWTVEDGHLHLWKIEEVEDNVGKKMPRPVAHLSSFASGTWLRAYLVSEK